MLVDSGSLKITAQAKDSWKQENLKPADLDISDLKNVRTWHGQYQVMVSKYCASLALGRSLPLLQGRVHTRGGGFLTFPIYPDRSLI